MLRAPTLDEIIVPSPKRRPARDPFQQLYPYYAGFPESFVRGMLSPSLIPSGSVVCDPWNGSGTTTTVASRLGFPAIGFDLNPVMVIVAKCRLLPASEASALLPLASAIIKQARKSRASCPLDEPLTLWFKPKAACTLRSIERSCADLLVGRAKDIKIENLSSIAAIFYTALFSVCRKLTTVFRTANPTWMRLPENAGERITISAPELEERFTQAVHAIAEMSAEQSSFQRVGCTVSMADATIARPPHPVDCIITSPPYCTRIDYTAGTRIELALIAPLVEIDADDLRRRMIGTTMVPARVIEPRIEWGEKCNIFLEAVRNHRSKASSGYYYATHIDYFDKMWRSIANLGSSLRPAGIMVLIVQDSFYKDIHNDLALMLTEMAQNKDLLLCRRADFLSKTCMSRVNSRAVAHGTRGGSTESVLFFVKQ